MIHREIEVMKRCQHPTIIKFRGFSLKDFLGNENVTLFMDLAPNGSLHQFLEKVRKRKCKLEYTNTHRQIILIGIVNGMLNIYNHHYMHRDLKTLNILLDDNLQPKITDFGLSKHYEKGDSINHSRFDGTSIYMAPEVINAEQFNEKSDVYSFGIVMYEVVTDCAPYSEIIKPGMDPFYLMNKIMNEKARPKFTTKVKKSLKKLIERCWSENPDERPTFEELYNKLAYNDEYIIKNADGEEEDNDDGEFKYYLDGVDVDAVFNYTDKIEKVGQNNDDEISSIKNQLKNLQDENEKLKKEIESLHEKANTTKVIEKDSDNNDMKFIFSLINIEYFNSLSFTIQMNIVSEMLKKGTKNKTLEEINTLLFGIEPMNIFKSIRIQTSRLDQPLIYLRSNYGIVLTLFNSVDRIMGLL